MMTRILSFIITYIAEGVIAWLYFDDIYERSQKTRIAVWTYLAGCGVFFALQLIGNVFLNIEAFFVITTWLALFNHRCRMKPAIFHGTQDEIQREQTVQTWRGKALNTRF